MTGLKKYWGYLGIGIGIILFLACGGTDDQQPKMKFPTGELIALSVYGERGFTDYKVYFRGWETDTPQTVFITDSKKETTYGSAYVLPVELVKSVWGDRLPELYHFTPQPDGTINVDEKTTALYLVMVAPPYFWMFTPRAIVFAAGHIIQHPEFKTLYQKVAEVKPGELLTEKSSNIFALASKIAEDVRESLLPAKATPRLQPELEAGEDCVNSRVAKIMGGGGTIKWKVRHMIFYGIGFYRGFEITNDKTPVKYAVSKAQYGKIDLSLDNILSFNIFNPEEEFGVDLPEPKRDPYGIRWEKGIELSTSVFTNPVKRVGLIANFGRAVKYTVEIVVPNIAACIPDGDTWGWVVATAQNLLTGQEELTLKSIFASGAWDEALNLISQLFQGSFLSNLLSKFGFSGCGYGVNFIINQIAATIRNFPLVKLWDAFTRYIPFGIELFTRPKTAYFRAYNGQPMPAESPVLSHFPQSTSSPGYMKLSVLPYGCDRFNCAIRINCGDEKGLYEKSFRTPPGTCEYELNLPLPPGFYGQSCILSLIFNNNEETSRKTISISNCPTCPVPSMGGKGGAQEEGGCSSAPVHSPYFVFAIAIIFILKAARQYYKEERD